MSGCRRPSEYEEILRPGRRSFASVLRSVPDADALNGIVNPVFLRIMKRRGDCERVRWAILLQVPSRIVTAP